MSTHATSDDLTPAAQALLDDLDRLTGRACPGCAAAVCGHEVLFSIALGCKDLPRCLHCLAGVMERPPGELRDDLREHFRARDCFSLAWETASRHEPLCPAAAAAHEGPARREDGDPALAVDGRPIPLADRWDAGDLACGDLVLALRRRMNDLPPAAVLEVVALDPAAPEDLPAWCRLTGHVLLRASHPHYYIQRRKEK